MTTQTDADRAASELWHKMLIEGHKPLWIMQKVFRYLPAPPRCKVCHNPFGGLGGKLVGLFGFKPSRKNPNLCATCCENLPRGGAEVDIAVLFADVRGSTGLGENLTPRAYAALLNRFYDTATEVLIRHDAIIDKLIGDEVMALFIRGICGPDYRERAVQAASALLRALGYGGAVNSGLAYVGNVGGEVVDFTALGDTVNTASRMAGSAGAGEVLLSEPVYKYVAESFPKLERRTLSLRGKEAPTQAWILGAIT